MLRLQAKEATIKRQKYACDLEEADLSIRLRSINYQAQNSSGSKGGGDITKNSELNVKGSSDMNNLHDNWQTFLYLSPSFLSVKWAIR